MRLSILKAAGTPIPLAPPPPPASVGEPHEAYPRNNRNQPEFGSVVITLDHLLDSDDFHVKQKVTYSTEQAHQALHSLFHYYKDPRQDITNSEATFEVMLALRNNPDTSMALYFVPAETRDRKGGLIVQVVASMLALQRCVNAKSMGDGSALLGMNALVNAVQDLAGMAMKKMGAIPPLMLLDLSEEAPTKEA